MGKSCGDLRGAKFVAEFKLKPSSTIPSSSRKCSCPILLRPFHFKDKWTTTYNESFHVWITAHRIDKISHFQAISLLLCQKAWFGSTYFSILTQATHQTWKSGSKWLCYGHCHIVWAYFRAIRGFQPNLHYKKIHLLFVERWRACDALLIFLFSLIEQYSSWKGCVT